MQRRQVPANLRVCLLVPFPPFLALLRRRLTLAGLLQLLWGDSGGEVAHQYRQRGLPYLPDQVRAWCGLWEHALEECAAGGLVGAAAKASARLQLGHTVAPFRAKIEEADPEGGECAICLQPFGLREQVNGSLEATAIPLPPPTAHPARGHGRPL